MILLSTTSQPPPKGFFVLRLDPSSALLVNPEQPLRGRSSGRSSRSIPRTAFNESSIDDIPSHQPRSEADIIWRNDHSVPKGWKIHTIFLGQHKQSHNS